HALLEAGLHFDVVDSASLSTTGYSALFLGDAVAPHDQLLHALRAYVSAGGLLVVTGETSLRDRHGKRRPDFAWADFLGVRFTGVSPFEEANYAWLGEELRGGAPDYPLLFRTALLEVECTTARPLAEIAYPAAHRTKEIFTDGETDYTHFGPRTGKPFITRNRVGQGSVLYIGVPLGREIVTRNDPWLKRLAARAVAAFGLPLSITSQLPPGVQMVFGRKDSSHIVSLVNHYPGMIVAGSPGPGLHVGPVQVEVPLRVLGHTPKSVQPKDTQGFAWSVERDTLRMRADSIGHHALLIIS
ncbi:MAG: beta-galactosidase trimerization domain-containing protein, partial [Acidobacteria bacterium]|nr:beta-galactosidase trimerization domain-containing protein [Acidobacteriota bacterium]